MSELQVCSHCGQVIPPEPKKRAWTAEDDNALREMITRGDNHKVIAAALERPVTSIRSRLNTLSRNRATGADRAPQAAPRPSRAFAVAIDDEADAMPKKTVEERPGVRIITHRIA